MNFDIRYRFFFVEKTKKVNKSFKKLLLSINDGMEIKVSRILENEILPKSSEKTIRTICSLDFGKSLIEKQKNDKTIFTLKLSARQRKELADLKAQFEN